MTRVVRAGCGVMPANAGFHFSLGFESTTDARLRGRAVDAWNRAFQKGVAST